jgi:hypothetical protein
MKSEAVAKKPCTKFHLDPVFVNHEDGHLTLCLNCEAVVAGRPITEEKELHDLMKYIKERRKEGRKRL